MTLVVLDDVVDDGLGPISLRFQPGLFTLFGDSLICLGHLVEILAGVRRARRGRALLDGSELEDDPNARRRVAAVLPTESLLPARRVSDSLELAAALHGETLGAGYVLGRAGLARFGQVPPEHLGPSEQRALALALALSLERSELLLLHDPFALHALLPKATVIARCRERAQRACVVVTTPQIQDAIELGGSACRIERGRPVPHAGLAASRALSVGLIVRSHDAERLAELSAAQPAFQYVLYDRDRSTRELSVFGASLGSLAQALCELARKEELSLDALVPIVPPQLSGVA
jgi:ABC-type nitrate/sulfonate/bicarbonate transport system ATPase subunit